MGCGHHITTVRLPKTHETNNLYIIISGTAAAVGAEGPLFVWGCHIQHICCCPGACPSACSQPPKRHRNSSETLRYLRLDKDSSSSGRKGNEGLSDAQLELCKGAVTAMLRWLKATLMCPAARPRGGVAHTRGSTWTTTGSALGAGGAAWAPLVPAHRSHKAVAECY